MMATFPLPRISGPTAADVSAAAMRMKGMIHRTPLLESIALNNLTGARVLVKAECLQKTGTFKYRGALNRILLLSEDAKARGVIAFSSGNFGQVKCDHYCVQELNCGLMM